MSGKFDSQAFFGAEASKLKNQLSASPDPKRPHALAAMQSSTRPPLSPEVRGFRSKFNRTDMP